MNVPPSHYMVSIFSDFDRPEQISLSSHPDDAVTNTPYLLEEVPCQRYLP